MIPSRRFLCILAAFLVCGLPVSAWAQSTLLYQGQVFGAHGPVNATYHMTFRLYDVAEGGESIWLETFENREMMKAVVHWQAKNHVSILTFHHDKISESGSFEHLNKGGTHLDEAEYDSMTEEEKADTIDEEEA